MNESAKQEKINQILESVGYKVVHTRYITEKTLLPFITETEQGDSESQ